MLEFSDAAAIKIANEYLDHPNRYRSEHDETARAVVTKTTIMLAKIAHSVSVNALEKKEAEFVLQLVTDPRVLKPATVVKKPDEAVYVATIALAFVESLFDRVVAMADLPPGKFDPGAFVAFASITAIGHEFSHGIYGHCEVGTNDKQELYWQELDADRRSGSGSFVVVNDRDVRRMMADFFGIRDNIDLLEVAIFSQSLLAFSLSGTTSAIYANSALRSFLYFDGLRSVVLLKMFANPLEIEYARKNADRLAEAARECVPGGAEIVEIRSKHDEQEKLWRETLKAEVFAFADRMIARSRFRE